MISYHSSVNTKFKVKLIWSYGHGHMDLGDLFQPLECASSMREDL